MCFPIPLFGSPFGGWCTNCMSLLTRTSTASRGLSEPTAGRARGRRQKPSEGFSPLFTGFSPFVFLCWFLQVFTGFFTFTGFQLVVNIMSPVSLLVVCDGLNRSSPFFRRSYEVGIPGSRNVWALSSARKKRTPEKQVSARIEAPNFPALPVRRGSTGDSPRI